MYVTQIIFRYVLTLTVIYTQYIMKLWLIVKEMFTNGNLLNINLCDYELNTHKLANDITIPYDALCCRITNCTLHNSDIALLLYAIISVLHKSADNLCAEVW